MLKGYRTYISMGLLILVAGVEYVGWLPTGAANALETMLIAAGIGFNRAARGR